MQIDTSHQTVFFVAPVCDVCKKQDENLRAVSLPFVFSIVFFTFTRSFTGVYCRKHRRLYLALASLITATAGWLGIPFGFIQTPLALFRLANGGVSDLHVNALMQRELANKRLMQGDQKGAVRSLEESLKYEDDPQTRQRLTDLYRTLPPETHDGMLRQVWGVLGVFLVSILMGLLAGAFDAGLGYLLYPLFEQSGSIFVIILSWVPMVLAVFFGILWIRSMVGSALRTTQASSRTLGISLAAGAALLGFFSFVQTRALLMNITTVLAALYLSTAEGFYVLRSLLTTGGLFNLLNSFRLYDTAGIIYLILFAAGFGLCLYATLRSALQIVEGQARLAGLRSSGAMQEGEGRSLWAWLTLGGLGAAVALSLLLLSTGKPVNVEEAFSHVQQGLNALDQNDEEFAREELQKAEMLWPDSVLTHMGRSSVELAGWDIDAAYSELQAALKLDPESAQLNMLMGSLQIIRGEYRDAVQSLKVAEAAQPGLAESHALQVLSAYMLDEETLLKQELEHAVALSETSSVASALLGRYYLRINDLESAEKYYLRALNLGNSPTDYVNLANLYTLQKKMEKAGQVLDEAERLGADPSEIVLVQSYQHQQTRHLGEAAPLVLKALEADPENPELLSEMSFIYNQTGDPAKALEMAEKSIRISRYDFAGYVELAYALRLQGRGAEAREAIHEALRLFSKSDRAHYVLGLIYLDEGMKTEAARELETFLDLYYEREYINLERQNALKLLEELR